MKKPTLSISLLLILGAGLLIFLPHRIINPLTPAARTVEFRYSATIEKLSTAMSIVKLWLPLPSSSDHQTVSDLTISCPYSYKITREPHSGNSMLYVEIKRPEAASFKVDVNFKVKRREYRSPIHSPAPDAAFVGPAPKELKRYLQPSTLIPTTGEIRHLALQITAGKSTPLTKARAIYDYVTSNLHYDKTGTGWGRGDAVYACDVKHGNCTDFHSLFIAMARSVGIPAQFKIGFPLPEDQTAGEVPGYHCWAEFFSPGIGWIPIDSSEASQNKSKVDYFFGAIDANRIQFTQGRDLELSPPQSGKPLNFFIYPYVEVDGKPYAEIAKKFTFEEFR